MLQRDIIDEGKVFLLGKKEYVVKGEEASPNPAKVYLLVDSEVEDEEILIEVDIEKEDDSILSKDSDACEDDVVCYFDEVGEELVQAIHGFH